ncbi:MAG TPA: hypothetical protein VFQ25_04650 [Ktedonobacterales bacterium]|nr:hypothetical protein [Ktedonobacterales bacterium]
MALTTGARLGELLRLTWSAVSLDGPRAGTLEIRASLRVKDPQTDPRYLPYPSYPSYPSYPT